MNKSRVFISYSHEDQPLVQSVVHWLKNSEFRSAHIDDPANWVSWGDDVRTLITDKIRRADTVLLLWSDRAAKSPWVQYEVGIAQAFDIPIRILLAGESSSKPPTGLGETQVIKLDVMSGGLAAAGFASNSVQSRSVSTALEDLKQQSQRIEQKIEQVSEMLSSTKPQRPKPSGGSRKEQLMSAAARKRIAEAQRQRWRDKGKRKATAKSGAKGV
jgi:hypothetical protein